MRLIYTSEARLEITEAAAWYRRISKGLAVEFKQRLTAALEAIKTNPETWRPPTLSCDPFMLSPPDPFIR